MVVSILVLTAVKIHIKAVGAVQIVAMTVVN